MSKQQEVTVMFNHIADHYDFLNHLFSLNIDRIWRKRVSHQVKQLHPHTVLDVATGTADLALRMAHDMPEAEITGVDLSESMLDIARKKLEGTDNILLDKADVAHLPYPDRSFDAVTAAFGVRNFEDISVGLKEMARVVKEGGKIFILDFSTPSIFPIKQLYRFYFKNIIPWIGRVVSRDAEAYRYLPESVEHFPQGEEFGKKMEEVGMEDVEYERWTFGIATLYVGRVV